MGFEDGYNSVDGTGKSRIKRAEVVPWPASGYFPIFAAAKFSLPDTYCIGIQSSLFPKRTPPRSPYSILSGYYNTRGEVSL